MRCAGAGRNAVSYTHLVVSSTSIVEGGSHDVILKNKATSVTE